MFTSSILLASLWSSRPWVGQEILSAEAPSPFDSKFEGILYSGLDHWHVPGIAIGVVDGDHVWTEGYGIATYPSIKVTPSTNFYAGSTTKAFTASALSLLIDNSSSYSSIQWSTPISHLIRDDFVLENEYATTHTTIEDALSHRSGMPRHDFSYGGNYPDEGGIGMGVHKGTIRDAVRALRWLPLTAEPRVSFQYCNMMFVVVSHVVETLTGAWLGDFLKERIWGPLGMHGTYFSTTDALSAPQHLAQGYVYLDNEYQPVPYMDLDIVSGAGSVISNVNDYTKWLQCLLSSSLPISPAGHAALKTPHSFIPSEPDAPWTGVQSYTLGWWTGVYKGHEYFEHSGGMEAFGAQLIFFPKLNYGLVTFGNTAMSSNALGTKLIWHLVDEKLGIPKEERYPWDARHQKQLDKMIERYNNASKALFPQIPDPPLPPSLPLESYAGTYFHPGYRNMTIIIKDGKLHCDRDDASWKVVFDFQHVSGDHFLAYVDSATAPGLLFKDASAAEFVISSDGVSKRFGLDRGTDTDPVWIWFDRI